MFRFWTSNSEVQNNFTNLSYRVNSFKKHLIRKPLKCISKSKRKKFKQTCSWSVLLYTIILNLSISKSILMTFILFIEAKFWNACRAALPAKMILWWEIIGDWNYAAFTLNFVFFVHSVPYRLFRKLSKINFPFDRS